MTGTPSLRSKTSGSMHGTQRHWTGCWRMTSSTPVYSGDIINKAQNIDWLTKHPRPANSQLVLHNWRFGYSAMSHKLMEP
jgi:hypothetical protein